MMRINKTVELASFINFAVTLLMLIGCASQSDPASTQSTSLLLKTATPLQNTATPKPTQTLQPKNPLPELPLSLGATWVYSDVVYSGSNPENIVTSTYIYTDMVITTQTMPPYFATEISRTVSLISGEPLFNAPEAGAWWYIISGTQVYKQPSNELDYSKILSSWLEYVFPLSQSGWYPDPDIRKKAPPDSMFSGKRYAYPNTEVTIPAGVFKDCFEIATAYLSGATYAWFCTQLGIVEEKVDHAGTPFGYHAVLMSYSIPSP